MARLSKAFHNDDSSQISEPAMKTARQDYNKIELPKIEGTIN